MNEDELYGLRQPRYGDNNGMGGGGMDWGDAVGAVAKYGIPLAALLRTSQQAGNLRDRTDLNLDKPELMTGRVRALRRPNFAPRRRDPAGSSLSEYIAGQRFNDAFTQSQVNQFNIADDSSRIQQENAIVDRTNQNTQLRTQIGNQEKFFRGQVAAQELLGNNLPFQQEAVIGGYHNIQSDLAQRNYVNSMSGSQTAATILTSPNSSEEDRNWARQYIMGGTRRGKVPMRAKGGKIKSKYHAGAC